MANGSVKRKGKVWSFVVDLGPDPATGRRRQARRSGFATKKAAEAALRDLASAADAGTAVARSRITVSQFLTDWLETIKPRVRETTWVSYRMAVDRITRQIGALQLQSLTPLQVEGLYATLLEEGGAGGRCLAPKTVRNCHIVLRRALADAERLGLVTRNPAAAAKAVSAPRGEQKTWSSEEIQRFFDAAAGERLSMAFVLLATTGMRRGEVLGLRWEDVDFDTRALSIVQTLTTVSNRLHIGPPKTGKSRRRLALDTVTLDALRAHRTRQLEERLAAVDVWSNDGDLVFTDELGNPVHPDRFSKSFGRLGRDVDLPRIRLHDLRHSYATLARFQGRRPPEGRVRAPRSLDDRHHARSVLPRRPGPRRRRRRARRVPDLRNHAVSFVDGELYERSFDTTVGRIDVLAEIVVDGEAIELRDIAVYPRGADRLDVPPVELLGWARLAAAEMANAGFVELRITGTRLTGATPGRRVDLTIRLRKEEP